MAITSSYEIVNNDTYGFPYLALVSYEDGQEVARNTVYSSNISSNYPELVTQYISSYESWVASVTSALPNTAEAVFTAEGRSVYISVMAATTYMINFIDDTLRSSDEDTSPGK